MHHSVYKLSKLRETGGFVEICATFREMYGNGAAGLSEKIDEKERLEQ